MARKMKETDTQLELQESLEVFDKNGDGYLNARELRHLVTQMGEKMTEDEFEAMLQAAGASGQARIKADDFIRNLMAHE